MTTERLLQMGAKAVLAAICVATLGVPTSATAQNAAVPSVQPMTAPAGPNSAAPSLSRGTGEVIKLFKAGIAPGTIVAYVNNSLLMFNLTADDMVWLKQQGLPDEVTRAMMQRDGALRHLATMAYTQGQAPANGAAVQAAAPAPASSYADATYAYDYPYYYGDYGYYPYSYWPPLYFGFGGVGFYGGHYYGGRFYDGGHFAGRAFTGGHAGGGAHVGGFGGGHGGGGRR